MGNRRSSLSDVLTKQQYRDLLQTAAKIKDREESLTLYFLLVVTGRCGLRIGEAIHMTRDWFDAERGVIDVPPHLDCECGLCRSYASKMVDRHEDDEDLEDLTFEEALDRYWMVKDGSDRQIPIVTDRAVEIIELYFDEVPYESLSYSTALRRLKKVGELTDSVNGQHIYGHMMRATCATHYTWAGVAPAMMDVIFGWADEKTKQRYTKKTAILAKRELRRVRGKDDVEEEYSLRTNPPTYTNLRPDDRADLIEVETWTPQTSVESSPRFRDDEEWLQAQVEEYNVHGPISASLHAYWNAIGRAVRAITPRVQTFWEKYVGVDFQQWLQQATWRRAVTFSLSLTLGLGLMAIMMARVGVYIDPSTLTLQASETGLLGLLVAFAVHIGTAGNIAEMVLADLTDQDRLAEILTLRPDQWLN